MADYIKSVLSERIPITMTPALATAIVKYVNTFETRGSNPEALNTYRLGCTPCYFLTKDRDDFFALFNTDEKEMKGIISKNISRDTVFGVKMTKLIPNLLSFFKSSAGVIKGLSASEMRSAIKDIPSIDPNFNVASDPLNVFITYLIYKVTDSSIPVALKQQTVFKLIMLLQYKFFTSLVNHRFKYKPDEAAMDAMFEGLTNKFDIKVYGTWKKVMEARAEQFSGPDSIHKDTFINYDDDARILYFITDTQTRIRNQINLIVQEFMAVKESQDRIGSYSHMGTDLDGDRVLLDTGGGFDIMTTAVYQDALVVSRFLDEDAIRLCSKLFNSLTASKLRQTLITFSEYAVKQTKAGQQQLTTETDGVTVYVGAQVLILNTIQKSYRYCINNKVDMNSKVAILRAVKDVYGSSRVNDQGIIQIRASVAKLIDTIAYSPREATSSALRIAFILYIILLSFKYLK